MPLILERIRMESMHLWRKLTGAKARARAKAEVEFNAAVKSLRPGDVAIDLGANVGVFTKAMADTGASVIAFEPDPHAFSLLEKRVGGMKNVTLIPSAAGAEPGHFRLYRHRDFDASPDRRTTSSSLVAGKRHMDETNSVEVEVKDFTRFLHDLARPVKLLKIDIEGAEVALLERLLSGAEAAMIDRIFVETHERVLVRLAARTRALKALAATMDKPRINWDWH